ncbi:MAG: hypothetical protein ACYCT2_09155 [Thermoplasmataceae archaeon]
MLNTFAQTEVISRDEWASHFSTTLTGTPSISDLTAVLSNVENEQLIRPNPCDPIIRKDKERKPVLYAFVQFLETQEDLALEERKTWVKSIEI